MTTRDDVATAGPARAPSFSPDDCLLMLLLSRADVRGLLPSAVLGRVGAFCLGSLERLHAAGDLVDDPRRPGRIRLGDTPRVFAAREFAKTVRIMFPPGGPHG